MKTVDKLATIGTGKRVLITSWGKRKNICFSEVHWSSKNV